MTTINTDNSSTLSQLAAMLSRLYHSTVSSTKATSDQSSDSSTTSVVGAAKSSAGTYNRDFISGSTSISGDGMSVLLGNQEAGPPQGPTAAEFSSWFNSADTDTDGTLSEAEFVAARPDTVTEEEASSLFAELDIESAGSITEEQLVDGLTAYGPPPPPVEDSSSAIAEKFASMDTDGDGKVSKAEFVAARPDGATEAQSEELFNQIDTEGTGSISEEQFADALSSVRGAPPPAGGGGSEDSETTTTTRTVNADGSITVTVKDAEGNVVSETTTNKAASSEETDGAYKEFLQALLNRKDTEGDMQSLFDILDKQLSA